LPFRALAVVFGTPKVLGWTLLSSLVTAATIVTIAVAGWPLTQGWADALVGSGSWWRDALAGVLGFAFFVVLFVSGVLTLPNVVLAPLQDPLSEATEAQLGDFTPPPFSVKAMVRGVTESLGHTLARLALSLLGFLVLLPLNLIPVVGSVAWMVLSSLWTMYWLAVEYLSGPMARHLYPFRRVLSALRARLPLTMGFGAALYVMLWIPVVNFFLMPVAVVAATLLYRALKAAGALGEPPGQSTT